MPDGAGAVVYSVDTNAFMDWQARYYPTDVFKSLVAHMAGLVQADRLQAAALVHEEIDAVGTPELVGWAKTNSSIFVPTKDLLADALTIQDQFPGLRDPKAEHEEADAYVITLARLRDGIVVTQETPAAEKKPAASHPLHSRCLPRAGGSMHQPARADAAREVGIVILGHRLAGRSRKRAAGGAGQAAGHAGADLCDAVASFRPTAQPGSPTAVLLIRQSCLHR